MYEIITVVEWDSAHRVPLHTSKCRHLHGHRYKGEFTICSDTLTVEGFVIDFGDIKKVIKDWIDEHMDHNTIAQRSDDFMTTCDTVGWQKYGAAHKKFYLMEEAPTVENIAQELLVKLQPLVAEARSDGGSAWLTQIRLWETPNNSAVVRA